MTETAISADDAYRRETDRWGMYLFLASEVMLFGALIGALIACRILYPEAAADASRRLNLWLGTANTAVLLTSSLMVAIAGEAARADRRRVAVGALAAAIGLGLLFLAIKATEYYQEYADGLMPGVADPDPTLTRIEVLFLNGYFVATGLHAIHMLAGIVLLATLAIRVGLGRTRLPGGAHGIELGALYWHLVDMVWVFLYPALYLVRA